MGKLSKAVEWIAKVWVGLVVAFLGSVVLFGCLALKFWPESAKVKAERKLTEVERSQSIEQEIAWEERGYKTGEPIGRLQGGTRHDIPTDRTLAEWAKESRKGIGETDPVHVQAYDRGFAKGYQEGRRAAENWGG